MGLVAYSKENEAEFFSRKELARSLLFEVEAVCFKNANEPEILHGEANALWAPIRLHLEEIPLGGLCYFEKVQEVQQTLVFATSYAQAIAALNSNHEAHIDSYFSNDLAPQWRERFATVDLTQPCRFKTQEKFRRAMQLSWLTISPQARLPRYLYQFEDVCELPSGLNLPTTDKDFQEIGMEAAVATEEVITEAYLTTEMKFCKCAAALLQTTWRFARIFKRL